MMIKNNSNVKIDVLTKYIFSWLILREISVIARSSKYALRLLSSSGLFIETAIAPRQIKVSSKLNEKLLSISSSGLDEMFLRSALKPAQQASLPLYSYDSLTIQKFLSLCPFLQRIDISYPTDSIIDELKSLKFLTHLSLGKIGVSCTTCVDKSFIKLMERVGSNLVFLTITKLNSLTSKALNGITQSCKSLSILSIISCNNIRLSMKNTVFPDKVSSDLFSAIGQTIEYLDLRYSIDINDAHLHYLMKHLSIKGFRIFTASRTIFDGPESKLVKTDKCLSSKQWSKFVDQFHNSSLLYVDNIGNEAQNRNNFIYNKSESYSRCLSTFSLNTHLVWRNHFYNHSCFFNSNQILSPR